MKRTKIEYTVTYTYNGANDPAREQTKGSKKDLLKLLDRLERHPKISGIQAWKVKTTVKGKKIKQP